MRLTDKVDVEKTARRFGVSREDVKSAITEVVRERGGELSISVTRRRHELNQYIRHVYDEAAKNWDFQDMVHMLATYHTELLARGIVHPERFGKEAAKVASDVAKFVYPKETAKITRSIPVGETKEEILERLTARLSEHTKSLRNDAVGAREKEHELLLPLDAGEEVHEGHEEHPTDDARHGGSDPGVLDVEFVEADASNHEDDQDE